MGEHDIQAEPLDSEQLRVFTQRVLRDLRAFQRMIEEDRFESGVCRIGAEQELFLIDDSWRPALVNVDVLAAIDDPHFTTELGRFNMEFNLDPIDLAADSLDRLEGQLDELLAMARAGAEKVGAQVLMTGILPTLDKSDLTLDAMTPVPRYYALNDAMNRLRGGDYQFRIQGRDEIIIRHDNVMLEACNTSFQVHLQVEVDDFARCYNVAQAIAAPVLAGATNSPLLFGRFLWRETRIALFEQSVDTRLATSHVRDQMGRVSFGQRWIEGSPIEIFQEDISRFRVILKTDVDENPMEVLDRGEVPELKALRLHNGTVYRWNRPCYGITDGKPHIRIENRVLPAGPTVADEVANAAFWFGLMAGLPKAYPDITRVMAFDEARENFVAAARLGLGANFTWPGHVQIPSRELILEELLPIAGEGLMSLGFDMGSAKKRLDVIADRVRTGRTGSQWLVDSTAALRSQGNRTEALKALVAVAVKRQNAGRPVVEWDIAHWEEAGPFKRRYERVEEIMTSDLFTVNEEEVVDMVASVMDWRHVRRIPVEDNQHRLVGLVTYRRLLRILSDGFDGGARKPIPVRDVMERNVITVRPWTSTLDAIRMMQEHKIGCLPVVDREERLVGIVTEHDFMEIARPLLEKALADD